MHPAWAALLVGHGLIRPHPSSRLARRAPPRPLAGDAVHKIDAGDDGGRTRSSATSSRCIPRVGGSDGGWRRAGRRCSGAALCYAYRARADMNWPSGSGARPGIWHWIADSRLLPVTSLFHAPTRTYITGVAVTGTKYRAATPSPRRTTRRRAPVSCFGLVHAKSSGTSSRCIPPGRWTGWSPSPGAPALLGRSRLLRLPGSAQHELAQRQPGTPQHLALD